MIRRLLLISLAALAVALAPAGVASADVSGPSGPSGPGGPVPEDATIDISLHKSGIVDRGTRWLLRDDEVLVLGKIKPYVAGQKVRIDLSLGGTVVDTNLVKVEPDTGGRGKFQHRFKVTKDGVYTAKATHDATAEQNAGESAAQQFRVIPGRVSGPESRRLLQISLNRLAFYTPFTGKLDDATRRAVLAYRKVNRYKRTGSPTPTVFQRLFHELGGYRVRYTAHPTHVESDLSRQILVLIKDGKPWQIYTISSGKPSTPTVKGAFSFYRRQPGTNSHGMVWSTYFHGGYAIHGYASVPATYPASHGCLRVPIPDSYRIYRSIYLGERIYVYAS
jgi:hypothetical protein